MRAFVLKFFKLFYKQMDLSVYYSVKQLAAIFFMQKIIGINRKVQWPVHYSSQIKAPENIIKKTNKNPGVSQRCYFDARNGIVFGENVWIGPGVSIISQNHLLTNYNKYTQTKPVKIGKNTILSANCIILPEVELADHTIVAAGAVVTKSFLQKNIVIGGNPAKILKQIDDYLE